MTREARLEDTEHGRVAATDGWFVVNVRDAAWVTNDVFGAACIFEGDDAPFAQLGFTLGVLQPGRPSGLYHREANQENLLVLSGACMLIVEGEERPLRQWDFVHFPAGTDHMVVATGNEPCVIFMTGARAGWPDKGIVYPRSDVALRHGAGVEAETTVASVAYAPFPKWRPGRPETVELTFD